jgi:uncharacterized membrane protein YbhN (UPF0104 family)
MKQCCFNAGRIRRIDARAMTVVRRTHDDRVIPGFVSTKSHVRLARAPGACEMAFVNRRWHVALAVCISALLIAALVESANLATLWPRVAHADRVWTVVAAACAVAVLLFRGLRFATFTQVAPLNAVIGAIGVQNLILRVTPLRLGELALPVVLTRFGESELRTGIALVRVRLVELAIVLATGIAAASARLGPERARGLVAAAMALAFVIGSLAFLSPLLGAVSEVLERTLARFPRLERLREPLSRLAQALSEEAATPARRRATFFAASAAVTTGQYAMLGALARAFGLPIDVMDALVAVSIAQVASAIPLATVGTVGTYEMGWTLGFVAIGVPFDDAVATGVATQLVTLAFAALLALPCWSLLRRARDSGSTTVALSPSSGMERS